MARAPGLGTAWGQGLGPSQFWHPGGIVQHPATSACHHRGSLQKGLLCPGPPEQGQCQWPAGLPRPPPCPPCPASLNFLLRLPERPHTFRPCPSRPLCLEVLSRLLSPWALLPAPLHYRPTHRGLCRALGAALPCLWPAERALELRWAGHRGSSGSRGSRVLARPGCLGSPGSRFQEPFMAGRSCWPYFGMGLALPHMASSWPSLHWASLTLEPPAQSLVPRQGPHPSTPASALLGHSEMDTLG